MPVGRRSQLFGIAAGPGGTSRRHARRRPTRQIPSAGWARSPPTPWPSVRGRVYHRPCARAGQAWPVAARRGSTSATATATAPVSRRGTTPAHRSVVSQFEFIPVASGVTGVSGGPARTGDRSRTSACGTTVPGGRASLRAAFQTETLPTGPRPRRRDGPCRRRPTRCRPSRHGPSRGRARRLRGGPRRGGLTRGGDRRLRVPDAPARAMIAVAPVERLLARDRSNASSLATGRTPPRRYGPCRWRGTSAAPPADLTVAPRGAIRTTLVRPAASADATGRGAPEAFRADRRTHVGDAQGRLLTGRSWSTIDARAWPWRVTGGAISLAGV